MYMGKIIIFWIFAIMPCCCFNTSVAKAIQLLKSVDNQLEINPAALAIMETLPSPVKVFAAVGDARVGKSTALNFIYHVLDESNQDKKLENVFETGNTMEAVTRGVWLMKPNNSSVLFLDVEGTDLGNDEVTTKVSIFTALMSSQLMFFMRDLPTNHALEFLYKMCRLNEMLDLKNTKEFPSLTAVLRGALEVPSSYKTIEDYIKERLHTGDKGHVFQKYFPKEKIYVFKLLHLSNPDYLKDIRKSSEKGYLDGIIKIQKHLMNSPEKKTLNGAIMDGKALASMAVRLVKIMNNNENWNSTLKTFYELFEKENCVKAFENHIIPLLGEDVSADKLSKQNQEKIMELFKKSCIIGEEIGKAKEKLEIALIAAKKRSSFWQWPLNYFASGVATGAMATKLFALFFSDIQLKQKIIPVRGSVYECIGLQGVQWTWNEKAKKLGLNGKGEGVVAQEVERYYPWAVIEGPDGYKRVNYLVLQIMIKIQSLYRLI